MAIPVQRERFGNLLGWAMRAPDTTPCRLNPGDLRNEPKTVLIPSPKLSLMCVRSP